MGISQEQVWIGAAWVEKQREQLPKSVRTVQTGLGLRSSTPLWRRTDWKILKNGPRCPQLQPQKASVSRASVALLPRSQRPPPLPNPRATIRRGPPRAGEIVGAWQESEPRIKYSR